MWQQQAFVLDSKFNAYRASNHPNFRTLYIRRRSQLLREKSKQNNMIPGNTVRRKYLRIRFGMLQNRYNVQLESQSNSVSSQSTSLISLYKNILEQDISPQQYDQTSINISNYMEDSNAFRNVHHIYDQHSDAVTMLKFANNDKSKLCCASNDGTLSVCDVLATPPCVKAILRCHTGPVTGCDWSASDELIASCSIDGTICFWDAIRHYCLRCVSDFFYSSVLTCLFNPVNNNILVTGNKAGFVCVLNVSTGMYPKSGKLKIGGQILSLAVNNSGRILWVGNDKSEIVSLKLNNSTDGSVLTKCHRVLISPNRGAITSLNWKSWISQGSMNSMLLANCANNILCLYKVSENDGSLSLKKKFLVPHSKSSNLLRSTFCPIMSFRQGTCAVTTSEDSCVYFVDVERDSNYAINKLQGHKCLVNTCPTQEPRHVWHRPDEIRKAVKLVSVGKSIKSVAKSQHILYSVLQRYARKSKFNPNIEIKKYGGQTMLSPLVEQSVVANIIKCSEWGYPITELEISMFVKYNLGKIGCTFKNFENNQPDAD